MMKQFKNGRTRYDAADIENAFNPQGALTDGGASFLALIVGAPDPVRHPEEFAAWMASEEAKDGQQAFIALVPSEAAKDEQPKPSVDTWLASFLPTNHMPEIPYGKDFSVVDDEASRRFNLNADTDGWHEATDESRGHYYRTGSLEPYVAQETAWRQTLDQ